MIEYNPEEFRKIQKFFPNLYFDENQNAVKGELNFQACYAQSADPKFAGEWVIEFCECDQDECLTDVYSIRINLNKLTEPVVWESEGRLRGLAVSKGVHLKNVHINEDGSCCLGIFAESDQLTLFDFVLRRVYPYFVWQSYYEKYMKVPPCGDCPHDWNGAIAVRIADEERKIHILWSEQKVRPKGAQRSNVCSCGSGKKYKNCCLRIDKKRNAYISQAKKRLASFKMMLK